MLGGDARTYVNQVLLANIHDRAEGTMFPADPDAQYLLRAGRFFEPSPEKPPPGKPSFCTYNVGRAVKAGLPPGWQVAAGYWGEGSGHTWLVDKEGRSVDPTAANMRQGRYDPFPARENPHFGVTMTPEFAERFVVAAPDAKAETGSGWDFNYDEAVHALATGSAMKFNPNHEPAGSPDGGQFASGGASAEPQGYGNLRGFGWDEAPVETQMRLSGWEDSLTAHETAAVSRYKGGSTRFNGPLRGTETSVERTPHDVELLDSALAKATVPEDVTVYRGAYASALPSGNMVGQTFTDKGFASTSFDRDYAKGWGDGVLLKIGVPAGTHAGYVPSSERELILPRNSRYEVTSDRTARGWRYVGAQLVPDVTKSNPNHLPAGSPQGGQFAPADEGDSDTAIRSAEDGNTRTPTQTASFWQKSFGNVRFIQQMPDSLIAQRFDTMCRNQPPVKGLVYRGVEEVIPRYGGVYGPQEAAKVWEGRIGKTLVTHEPVSTTTDTAIASGFGHVMLEIEQDGAARTLDGITQYPGMHEAILAPGRYRVDSVRVESVLNSYTPSAGDMPPYKTDVAIVHLTDVTTGERQWRSDRVGEAAARYQFKAKTPRRFMARPGELGGFEIEGDVTKAYDPAQPRDDVGRWTSTGAGEARAETGAHASDTSSIPIPTGWTDVKSALSDLRRSYPGTTFSPNLLKGDPRMVLPALAGYDYIQNRFPGVNIKSISMGKLGRNGIAGTNWQNDITLNAKDFGPDGDPSFGAKAHWFVDGCANPQGMLIHEFGHVMQGQILDNEPTHWPGQGPTPFVKYIDELNAASPAERGRLSGYARSGTAAEALAEAFNAAFNPDSKETDNPFAASLRQLLVKEGRNHPDLRERVDRVIKYSDTQPRDDHGRWTAGSPTDVIEHLLAGHKPEVEPGDVGPVLDAAAKRQDNPDLTELKVSGTLLFGGEGRGWARSQMPQLEGATRGQFLDSLREQGVPVTEEDVDPHTLKPVQKEISAKGVGLLLQKARTEGISTRSLVSKDNYVIDGHHTWGMAVALAFERPGTTMPVTRVGLDHGPLLKEALAWDVSHGIMHHDMTDSPVATAVKFNPNHDEAGRFASGGGEPDTSYRSGDDPWVTHAPTPAYGAQLHDLAVLVPDDIYDRSVQRQYYGTGSGDPEVERADRESWRVINAVHNQPDAQVNVYRALPAAASSINTGDWVTLSPTYAGMHLAGPLNGNGHVISATVPAKSIWWDGNSINEFGYAGPSVATKVEKRHVRIVLRAGGRRRDRALNPIYARLRGTLLRLFAEHANMPGLATKFNPNHDEMGRFATSAADAWVHGSDEIRWQASHDPNGPQPGARHARELLRGVAAGQAAPRLYRGISVADGAGADAIIALKPGNTLDMNLSSWSNDGGVAENFAESIPEWMPVKFTLLEGARGLPVGETTHEWSEQEWVTDGHFTVVSKEPWQAASDAPSGFNITLKQVATFTEPDQLRGTKSVSKFNPYHDEQGRFTTADGGSGGDHAHDFIDDLMDEESSGPWDKSSIPPPASWTDIPAALVDLRAKYPDTKFNDSLAKGDPKLVLPALAGYDYIQHAMPGVAVSSLSMERFTGNDRAATAYTQLGDPNRHEAGATIHLSTQYFGPKADGSAWGQDHHWFPTGTDNPQGTVIHEFGHALFAQTMKNHMAPGDDQPTPTPAMVQFERGLHGVTAGEVETLSGYAAASDPPELFAEAFNAKYNPDSREKDNHFTTYISNIVESEHFTEGKPLVKYSDAQPRVPAGSPDGGRWTSGGGDQSIPVAEPSSITPPAHWADVVTAVADMRARHPGTDFSHTLEAGDPRTILPTLAALDYMQNRFPGVPVTHIGMDRFTGDDKGATAYTNRFPGDKGANIMVNADYYMTGGKLAQDEPPWGADNKGWFVSGTDNPQGSVIHEFGHAVYGELMARHSTPDAKVVLDPAMTEFTKHFAAESDKLSGYAAAGAPEEGFSEAFAAAYNPDSKQTTDALAVDMRSLLVAENIDQQRVAKYSADQPRDEHGRWSGGGAVDSVYELLHPDEPQHAEAIWLRGRLGYLTGLDADQRRACEKYSTYQYQVMNSLLRTGKPPDEMKYPKWLGGPTQVTDDDVRDAKVANAILQNVIENAPPLERQMTAYRQFDGTQFGDLKPGDRITDKGFVSVGLTHKMAREAIETAHPTSAVITLPAGTRATAISEYPELVLGHGSQFRVDKVDDKGVALTYLGLSGATKSEVAATGQRGDGRFMWGAGDVLIERDAVVKYSPDQPRDERGRWTSDGGSGRTEDAQVAGASARPADPSTIPPPKSWADIPTALTDLRAKYPGTKFEGSLRAADPAKLLPALAGYDYIQSRFPAVKVESIEMRKLPDPTNVAATLSGGREPASITLNSDKFKPGGAAMTDDKGWFVKGCDNPQGTLIHEFGHAVMGQMLNNHDPGDGTVNMTPAMQRYAAVQNDMTVTERYAVSGYGASGGADEMFAEVFTAAHDPDSKESNLSVAVAARELVQAEGLQSPTKVAKYSADQPRDERGRWTSDGGAGDEAAPVPVFLGEGHTVYRQRDGTLTRWPSLSTAYDDFSKRHPDTRLDFSGTKNGLKEVEMMAALDQLDKLQTRWPDVGIQSVTVVPPDRMTSPTYIAQTRQALDHTGRLRATSDIELNERFWGKADPKQGGFALYDSSKGFHPPGTDNPTGYITHEFGHAVENYGQSLSMRLRAQRPLDAQDTVAATEYRDFANRVGPRAMPVPGEIPAVSGYGASGPTENFAELFGATYTPGASLPDAPSTPRGTTPHEASTQLQQLMNDMFPEPGQTRVS